LPPTKWNLIDIFVPKTAREKEKGLNSLMEDVVTSSKTYSKSPERKMGIDQVTVETLVNTARISENLNSDKGRPGTSVYYGAQKNIIQE